MTAITIPDVMRRLGRPAGRLVACPVAGCEVKLFAYDDDRFACEGCGSRGDVVALAGLMGVGSEAEAFVRAATEALQGRDRTPDDCARAMLRGLRRAIAHRARLRRVEDARRRDEECATARRGGHSDTEVSPKRPAARMTAADRVEVDEVDDVAG